MKKIIRIAYHSAFSQATAQDIEKILGREFTVIVSKEYDYYFAMETIYYNKENMQEFLSANKNAIKIMMCGEAVYPDLNLFDYVIWHNRGFEALDRVIECPLLYSEIGYLFDDIRELDDSKKGRITRDILKEKTRFCNFIYSNPNSHPMRDKLFYEISAYKKVDSLGTHLKNMEIKDTRFVQGWEKISIDLKRPYKFSIAAENANFTGYTTEKLMSSMMANTIPIYWGNPLVGLEYNVKSFINVADYDSFEDLMQKIQEIDRNDNLYCEIMSQPWRTEKQIKECEQRVAEYIKNFNYIFEQDLEKAARRPKGCWPDFVYKDFFLKNTSAWNVKGSLKNVTHGIGILKRGITRKVGENKEY